MSKKKYIIENEQLIKEWHWEKNSEFGLDHSNITCGSKQRAWWICKLGHEYHSAVYSRSAGRDCPICHKEYKTSFPEQAVHHPSREWKP